MSTEFYIWNWYPHTYESMDSFLSMYGWASWIVASYEDWIFGPMSPIKRTFESLPPAKTSDGKRIRLKDLHIRPGPEKDTPSTCRTHRSTYTYELWCSISVDDVPRQSKLCIGKFPRMVSGHPFEAGFFVVDGMERVFVNRESMRYDTPRYRHKDHLWKVELTSLDAPMSLAYDAHTGEIKAHVGFASDLAVMDVWVLLKALGESRTPTEIWGERDGDARDLLHKAFSLSAHTRAEDALHTVGRALVKNAEGVSRKRARSYAADLIHRKVLPFMLDEEKGGYLTGILLRLAEFALGRAEATDVDAMQHKRIDTAGKFVARLVCVHLSDMWSRAVRTLAQKPMDKNVERWIDVDYILQNVNKGMKVSMDADEKSASIMPRKASWQEGLATARRVNADVGKSAFVAGPRMFHGTWYGFYCACETPEGERTGLTRDTAIFFRCSVHGDPDPWRRGLLGAGLLVPGGRAKVFVNQSMCVSGVDFDAAKEWCARYKRDHDVWAGIACFPDTQEIRVDVSEGRAMRPVWTPGAIVDPSWAGKFDDLITQGRVEWVDAEQCRTILISTTEQEPQKYMELHPNSVFGPSAANIPFADHNAGSRNLFGAHVRHQAVGFTHPFAAQTTEGTHDRFDTDETHHMWYPQRALCDTEVARKMQSHVYPNGWNAVIFILAKPWGQEDSMGIAKRHVDLGAGVMFTELSVEASAQGPIEYFGCTDAKKYLKLDMDGLPKVGLTFYPDDVLVCKRDATRETGVVKWHKKFPARVVSVCRSKTDSVLIRMGWRRTPEIGDKLASRHGQKGVINFEILDDATYWTKDGVTPDIIMNPAALPSRMTIGHVFEMLCGKANCVSPPAGFTTKGCAGSPTDCTSYSPSFDFQAVQDILRSHGFQPKGHEVVYNGTTGEVMEDCHVYVGPAFIQRLVHFSFTKCYVRGRGVRNPQTGQPPKGRRNEGGLRLGESESKAFNAHGGASALQAAFLDCSDGIEVFECPSCHEVGCLVKCTSCGASPCFMKKVPRTFFLLRDQLRVAKMDMRTS